MSQRTFRNESRDDYLEAILIIRQKKGFCRSTDIASWLGISRPSVSVELGKLAASQLPTRHMPSITISSAFSCLSVLTRLSPKRKRVPWNTPSAVTLLKRSSPDILPAHLRPDHIRSTPDDEKLPVAPRGCRKFFLLCRGTSLWYVLSCDHLISLRHKYIQHGLIRLHLAVHYLREDPRCAARNQSHTRLIHLLLS